MADDFDGLKVVEGTTQYTADYFNTWVKNWNDRLKRIEEGGLSWAIRVSGAVSAGRKLLFPVPTNLIKASFGFTVDGTVTTKIILDVFTGADRDTQGTSVWVLAASRPEIDTPSVTGFSGFAAATQGLPMAGASVIGIEVAQGAGPSNLTVLMRGEPGA
ncbi:MAG: hypothetical protein V3W19_01415 [Desulfatiglandales bacterium]